MTSSIEVINEGFMEEVSREGGLELPVGKKNPVSLQAGSWSLPLKDEHVSPDEDLALGCCTDLLGACPQETWSLFP